MTYWGLRLLSQKENKTHVENLSNVTQNVKQIAACGNHTCFVFNTGKVKCTGYNDYGQLGDGTYNNR